MKKFFGIKNKDDAVRPLSPQPGPSKPSASVQEESEETRPSTTNELHSTSDSDNSVSSKVQPSVRFSNAFICNVLAAATKYLRCSSDTIVDPQYMNSTKDFTTENSHPVITTWSTDEFLSSSSYKNT
ncbi:unnamed protein product [Acanthoscelides obtectus]|uniref:Uncharacterized protein n=1 Tax=Acanthoscelides obtectus TaxID=200917 RepID=A0A9P0QCI3_ACAOB|nr:unnamed protein product [Acanthoscelides obtectus]CAK1627615.1 hypothetical protein AOBTE_LOCUS4707 [Acanthoscelides obtectus]